MGTIIAVLNKKGENSADTAVAMLKALKPKNSEGYGVASPTIIKTKESFDALQKQKIESSVTVGYAFSKIVERDKLQPLKLDNATLIFDGRVYPPPLEISDPEAFVKELHQNYEKTAQAFIKGTEGDFVFVIAEARRLVAGRDVMGIRPLYYGENTDLVALASERTALWEIGIEKAISFPPGHVALVDKHGFRFILARKLAYVKPKQMTMHDASRKLQELLQQSTRERVSDLKDCAVAFSGGLDSSIIAFLAKNLGANVHLIHVSLENQPESEHAGKIAEELKLPVHSYTYKVQDVEKAIPKVLQLIERADPMQTSIGIPVYWIAEKAAEMDVRVMLAGQGADELFGGYKRYVDNCLQYGNEKVEETIFNDIVGMCQTNFERDSKICSFHNVELRLPFASYRMAKFAVDLPLELKMEPSSRTLRKLVLRQASKNLGLPQLIVNKPKKAIQYATGVNKALKEIAKKKGLSINEYLQKIFKTTFKKMTSHG